MKRVPPALGPSGAIVLIMTVGLVGLLQAGQAESERCLLALHHAGVTFPLDRLERGRACLIQPVIDHYTTANKIGPLRTPLPESVYLYLLDHPVMAAALVNRLDFGLYKAEQRGRTEFWATDGEGTEGVVHLVFQDRNARVYFVEGGHDGRFLPRVTGKAVVLLGLHPVTDGRGSEAIESTMVTYLRLDNRFLSGLLSLLRPLIGHIVNRQVLKAFEAARRLGDAMHEQPDQVLFEATDPPALPDEDVAFLKRALAGLHNPSLPAQPTP